MNQKNQIKKEQEYQMVEPNYFVNGQLFLLNQETIKNGCGYITQAICEKHRRYQYKQLDEDGKINTFFHNVELAKYKKEVEN